MDFNIWLTQPGAFRKTSKHGLKVSFIRSNPIHHLNLTRMNKSVSTHSQTAARRLRSFDIFAGLF